MLQQMDRAALAGESLSRRRGYDRHVRVALKTAIGRICPVWDVKSFVAANNLHGFEGVSFREAAEAARAYFHGDALMPVEFYQEQYQTGRITRADIRAALRDGRPEAGLRECDLLAPGRTGAATEVRTLAETIDQAAGTRYEPLIVRELCKWCAAYFDQGQAVWPMPGRGQRLYNAWREAARHDGACRWGGIQEFQHVLEQLPARPGEAVAELTAALGVPADDLADYLTRLLTRLPGWSGYILTCSADHAQGSGDLSDLIAMGLAYEWALVRSLGGVDGSAWEAVQALGQPAGTSPTEGGDLDIRHAWQCAYEEGYRRRLLEKLGRPASGMATGRPAVQAIFCIDVRSEVLRRHFERQGPPGRFQTFGFAGFFGFPIAHEAFGSGHRTARCPALLRPRFTVTERPVGGAKVVALAEAAARLSWSLRGAVSAAKSAATSCYGYVESLGLLFGAGMLLRTLAPGAFARLRGLAGGVFGGAATRPVLESPHGCAEPAGIPVEEQAAIARTALTVMGLTSEFGRIVLLCGHGSSSDNNPYAAALDCGACGGHEGGTNARVAAAVFNNPAVRERLAGWGIHVPDDTVFVAARHDTTTDEVTLLDEDLVPSDHAGDLAALKEALAAAGDAARKERAGRLGGPSARRRARDWSEVRPEWGLAGNAAFIAGSRNLTAGANLQGRVFLHSYDYRADPEGSSLEVILTAPLVVATWINLQYYLSTVDNRCFGSGDKALQNVVGKLGVMQGNHSDLQVGLPLQSISDGERLVHEPLRLTAVIQAPRERVAGIVSRHESVRRLVDNEWITLVVLDPDEDCAYRYRPGGTWRREGEQG